MDRDIQVSLAKEHGVSQATVSKAINGILNSKKAREIRNEYAKRLRKKAASVVKLNAVA